MAQAFTLRGFLIRWVVAVVLVLATFNPTSYSLVGWLATTSFDNDIALKALLAIVLVIGWAIYLRATFRSLGIFGIGLVVALLLILGWVVWDYGAVDAFSTELLVWIVLLAGSLILALGISWSHIRRRITGQMDVDDIGEM